MPIDDFFRQDDGPGNHPLLRLVVTRKKAGEHPVFELFRPKEALGFRKAKVFVHFLRDGKEVDYKDDDWDDDLNTGLVLLGVKAKTEEEEKDRFALGLRAAFKRPERRYGDGYFNAILVQFVRMTDFAGHPEVAGALKHIPTYRPNEGQSYQDCLDMIQDGVKGRAHELATHLGYQMPVAWNILAGAFARYLDERFSVTNRRLLGLL